METVTKFYMVYVDGKQSPNYKHATEELANKEAERLALGLPNNKVYVLQTIACCIHNEVKWLDFEGTNNNELPF